MKAIHIKLPNETVDVAVPKVLGQDCFLKLFNILDGELFAIPRPLDDPRILVVLNNKINTLMISNAFCTKLATELSAV